MKNFLENNLHLCFAFVAVVASIMVLLVLFIVRGQTAAPESQVIYQDRAVIKEVDAETIQRHMLQRQRDTELVGTLREQIAKLSAAGEAGRQKLEAAEARLREYERQEQCFQGGFGFPVWLPDESGVLQYFGTQFGEGEWCGYRIRWTGLWGPSIAEFIKGQEEQLAQLRQKVEKLGGAPQ